MDSAPLLGTSDAYKGVTVDPAHLPAEPDVFRARLVASIARWQADGRRGLWLRLPIARAALVPVAVELGFAYHHARPDYVMLTRWLPADEESKLPGYATHYVGCAAVVLHEGRILVVKERYADAPDRWKIPGGLANPGEDIVTAAQREVLEETGIATDYVSIMCFREKHEYLWGCTDLYFVVRLRPVATAIAIDPREIDECRWMPLDEFAALRTLYPTQQAIARLAVASLAVAGNTDGGKTDLQREYLPPQRGSVRPMSLFRNAQGLPPPDAGVGAASSSL